MTEEKRDPRIIGSFPVVVPTPVRIKYPGGYVKGETYAENRVRHRAILTEMGAQQEERAEASRREMASRPLTGPLYDGYVGNKK